MKQIIHILVLFSFFPVGALCQGIHPELLQGTLIIGEKPVEFNYLSLPDGTSALTCFTHLPSRHDYDSNTGRVFIPLGSIKKIRITHLTSEERAFLHDSCADCMLYKARITCRDLDVNGGEPVFVALSCFIWKNTHSADFCQPHVADLKFVDAVEIRE